MSTFGNKCLQFFVPVSTFENKCLHIFVCVSTFENKCLKFLVHVSTFENSSFEIVANSISGGHSHLTRKAQVEQYSKLMIKLVDK